MKKYLSGILFFLAVVLFSQVAFADEPKDATSYGTTTSSTPASQATGDSGASSTWTNPDSGTTFDPSTAPAEGTAPTGNSSAWTNPDSGTTFDPSTAPVSYDGSSSSDGWNLSSLDQFNLPNPSGGIGYILYNILMWILAIFGILGVISFVISGLMYLVSAGDSGMTGNAKKAMMASIIGVIIGLSGLVVLRAVYWALSGFSNI